MTSLFGTDGVRGVANIDISPDLAIRLARATAAELLNGRGRVIIGMDTRLSGPMLESSLAAGFASAGADACLAGIIPTPAISFLIKDERADLGAVISASHNPPIDNGIKFFDRHGMKLSVEQELSIEQRFDTEMDLSPHVGQIRPLEAAATRYAAFLAGAIDMEHIDLSGLTLVVDCAYGATGAIAPRVLRHLGAEVIALHCEPDGMRINQSCGSTNLDPLRTAVRDENADLGIAFDGDGDRVLLVTAQGDVVDGDQMIGIAAAHMHERGELTLPIVVTTIMSNLGLERYLADRGIRTLRTPVGDRHVARAMQQYGAQVGGEPSGHIILSDHSPTGDGILTAVKLLELAHQADAPLGDLVRSVPRYPQVHVNLPFENPQAMMEMPDAKKAIAQAEQDVGDNGRLVVRVSGTQPLIRVMVEAEDEELCQQTCDRLATALKSLGTT